MQKESACSNYNKIVSTLIDMEQFITQTHESKYTPNEFIRVVLETGCQWFVQHVQHNVGLSKQELLKQFDAKCKHQVKETMKVDYDRLLKGYTASYNVLSVFGSLIIDMQGISDIRFQGYAVVIDPSDMKPFISEKLFKSAEVVTIVPGIRSNDGWYKKPEVILKSTYDGFRQAASRNSNPCFVS